MLPERLWRIPFPLKVVNISEIDPRLICATILNKTLETISTKRLKMNVLKPFSQQEPPFPLSQILQEVIDRGASLKAFSDKYAKTIRRERNGTENWKNRLHELAGFEFYIHISGCQNSHQLTTLFSRSNVGYLPRETQMLALKWNWIATWKIIESINERRRDVNSTEWYWSRRSKDFLICSHSQLRAFNRLVSLFVIIMISSGNIVSRR